MNFPGTLDKPVRAALREIGDRSDIQDVRPVAGGCINNAIRLATGRGVYLLKWNAETLPGMFTSEADGLLRLAATHTVRVPVPLYVGEPKPGIHHPAFLLLEWLEGSRFASQAALGEQLAELHRVGVSPCQPPAYGLDQPNYLGPTRQENQWEPDWAAFFTQSRLLPQMELAQRTGHLSPARRQMMERLIDRLPGLVSVVERRPSLIHGDLWSGNVINGPEGLALIDPAVSFSDREAEIAYTELFGGFSSSFYSAYQHTWPLEPGYLDRRDLYNLYHLLNHLNLFGEAYGGQVDAVLRRYAGA